MIYSQSPPHDAVYVKITDIQYKQQYIFKIDQIQRYGWKEQLYTSFFHLYLSTGQTNRPKSQCEQHRDSLQSGVEQGGRPSPGAFIPQCDSDGRYRPLQVGTD